MIFPADAFYLTLSPLPKFWEGGIKEGWVSSYISAFLYRMLYIDILEIIHALLHVQIYSTIVQPFHQNSSPICS